jgi:hypothetical protein
MLMQKVGMVSFLSGPELECAVTALTKIKNVLKGVAN